MQARSRSHTIKAPRRVSANAGRVSGKRRYAKTPNGRNRARRRPDRHRRLRCGASSPLVLSRSRVEDAVRRPAAPVAHPMHRATARGRIVSDAGPAYGATAPLRLRRIQLTASATMPQHRPPTTHAIQKRFPVQSTSSGSMPWARGQKSITRPTMLAAIMMMPHRLPVRRCLRVLMPWAASSAFLRCSSMAAFAMSSSSNSSMAF